jgi:hypothetical protein
MDINILKLKLEMKSLDVKIKTKKLEKSADFIPAVIAQ